MLQKLQKILIQSYKLIKIQKKSLYEYLLLVLNLKSQILVEKKVSELKID